MPWYDGLDRLRQANGPWGGGSFGYDALDNLTTSTVGGRTLNHAYDASNRLVGLSGSQNIGIGYDANGNIASRGAQSFIFDIGNRMRLAPGKAGYVYDGHGRRNMVGFVGADYMHQAYTQDGKLRLAWRPSEGGRRHVYLGDQLLAEHMDGGITYQHTDALGSPVARTNSSGAVVSRTRYEPYGATVAGTTNPSTIGFTGHVNDADTGLVYMQQRYYDPIAGRFLSVDPVTTDAKTGDHFNRYVYANSNPYKFRDPDGRAFETAWNIASLVLSVQKFAQNPSLGNAIGVAVDAAAAAIPGIPGGVGALRAVDKAADAATGSTVVIGRKGDLAKPDAPNPGERKLGWEQKGDSKSNWKENSTRLREAMADGKPIRDASPGDKGGAYLPAERNLLENKGWSFDSKANHWMPPKE